MNSGQITQLADNQQSKRLLALLCPQCPAKCRVADPNGHRNDNLVGQFPDLELLSIETDQRVASVVGAFNVSLVANSMEALEKVSRDLHLTADEQRSAFSNLRNELECRAPQLGAVLSIISLLPVIASRAFRHFLHSRGESHHDAEELSQSLALKTLTALTGAWPRGNVGAWISAIRKNLYVDHLRKRGRLFGEFQDDE